MEKLKIDNSFNWNGTTTIQITNRTKKELSELGKISDTYNDVIWRLLLEHEEIESNRETIKMLDEELVKKIISTIESKKELISAILNYTDDKV